MLKGIDPLLHADLLHALASMGHGDEIAVVDNNFPAASIARRLVRVDGAGSRAVGRAILSVLPLDTFVEAPLVRMEIVGDPTTITPVQAEFRDLCSAAEGREIVMASLERTAFYERARSAYAVVATAESRPYGCFLLVKGVTYGPPADAGGGRRA
jgi:L-fucose mutarotase